MTAVGTLFAGGKWSMVLALMQQLVFDGAARRVFVAH